MRQISLLKQLFLSYLSVIAIAVITLTALSSFLSHSSFSEPQQYLISAGTALLLALFLALVLALKLTRPIDLLAQIAQKNANDDFEVHYPASKIKPLGLLSQALASMASQLKQQLSAISHSQQETHNILSSISESLVIINQDLQVLRVNEAAKRLFNYDPKNGPKQHLKTCIDDNVLFNELITLFDAQSRLTTEVKMPHEQVYMLNANLLPESSPPQAILIFHDVTPFKQLENTRKQFVANVSHELKTPITLIKGSVETLINMGDLKESHINFLSITRRHVDRFNQIIDDLLYLSKLESGMTMTDDDCQITQVSDLVTQVISYCQPKLLNKKINLHVDTTPNPININIDLCLQALINLLDNAIKYSPEKSNIYISARQYNGYEEICVRDEGSGIPKALHQKIFERFYRVDTARSRELGGTGLGLSIVKHIMAVHQGKVRVESAKNKGASFILSFPTPHT